MMPFRLATLSLIAALVASGEAAAQADRPDPLSGYYGNTIVCADGATGDDTCHIWLEHDRSFVLFGIGQGGHAGHYLVGPARPDGLVPVCLKLDNAGIDIPPELQVAPPTPSVPALACTTRDWQTRCAAPVSGVAQALPPDQAMLGYLHGGVCYPLGPHAVGDRWAVADDPLPAAGGQNQFLLLPGHR